MLMDCVPLNAQNMKISFQETAFVNLTAIIIKRNVLLALLTQGQMLIEHFVSVMMDMLTKDHFALRKKLSNAQKEWNGQLMDVSAMVIWMVEDADQFQHVPLNQSGTNRN